MAVCLRTLLRSCAKHQRLVFGLNANKTVKRSFLSTSYGQTDDSKEFSKIDGNVVEDISTTCLFIDRCTERNQPYTSLTIDKMVRAIHDRDDIVTSMYYLYKFRHSDACYFLRPWTVHIWFRKCIEHDAKDLALKALDESSHHGLFPDNVAFNMLLWDCLRNDDFDLAFKFASHMFLLERLDSKLSQSLCLMTILKKLKTQEKSEEQSSILPDFSSLLEKRNFGGICLRLGQLMNIKDITLLGYGILGTIEKEDGIRSVYQDPWAPLPWEEGYFERGLELINADDIAVSRAVLNILLEFVKNNEELTKLLNEKISIMESENLVSDDDIFEKLNEKLATLVPEAEKLENVAYENALSNWVSEYKELCDIGKEIGAEYTAERTKYFEMQKISKVAKRMAIEQLGYWEFSKDDDEEVDKNVSFHLQGDYVQGSMSDVEIERRRNNDEAYYYPNQSVAKQ